MAKEPEPTAGIVVTYLTVGALALTYNTATLFRSTLEPSKPIGAGTTGLPGSDQVSQSGKTPEKPQKKADELILQKFPIGKGIVGTGPLTSQVNFNGGFRVSPEGGISTIVAGKIILVFSSGLPEQKDTITGNKFTVTLGKHKITGSLNFHSQREILKRIS